MLGRVKGMENANGKHKNSAEFDSKLIFYNFNSSRPLSVFLPDQSPKLKLLKMKMNTK